MGHRVIVTQNCDMGTAACHRSKNRAFRDPDHAHERSIRAAQAMCGHCPILRQCAREALTSGAALDGTYLRPASGVVQAGVVCRGDQSTAIRLAEVAGVTTLPVYEQQEPRPVAPDACVSCGMPMVRWTRDRVPDGYVMHHARGFCTGCRREYAEFMRSQPRRPRGLRKPVDRKRRHAVSARRGRRELVVQLSLF